MIVCFCNPNTRWSFKRDYTSGLPRKFCNNLCPSTALCISTYDLLDHPCVILAKIKIIEINIMSMHMHAHNSHHNKGILKNGKPYRDFYPRWVGLSSRLLNENGYLINIHITLSGVCVMVFVAPLILRIKLRSKVSNLPTACTGPFPLVAISSPAPSLISLMDLVASDCAIPMLVFVTGFEPAISRNSTGALPRTT